MPLKKSDIRVIVLSAFYVLYLVIGASIFSAIEGPEERTLIKQLRRTRNRFLHTNKACVTGTDPLSLPISLSMCV